MAESVRDKLVAQKQVFESFLLSVAPKDKSDLVTMISQKSIEEMYAFFLLWIIPNKASIEGIAQILLDKTGIDPNSIAEKDKIKLKSWLLYWIDVFELQQSLAKKNAGQ